GIARPSHGRGHWFETSIVHHFFLQNQLISLKILYKICKNLRINADVSGLLSSLKHLQSLCHIWSPSLP
ncbi:hypothetical protein, partial [uncultured Parasutterella sp.]|uniref:hypothetical protein n=1 Tax=uncultured Parasutterella sp. TaxID=1263098 RepID=UPI00259AD53D